MGKWLLMLGLLPSMVAAQVPEQHPLPMIPRAGKPDCAVVQIIGHYEKTVGDSVHLRAVWSAAGDHQPYLVHWFVNGKELESVPDSGTAVPAKDNDNAHVLVVGAPFAYRRGVEDTVRVYVEPVACSQSFGGGEFIIPAPKDATGART